MCIYDSFFTGALVLSIFGSWGLKKNWPKPCATAWLICCSAIGSKFAEGKLLGIWGL